MNMHTGIVQRRPESRRTQCMYDRKHFKLTLLPVVNSFNFQVD